MKSSDFWRHLRSIGPRVLAGGIVAWSVQTPATLSIASADDSGAIQVASAQQQAWSRAVCLAELAWLGNPATFHEHLSAVLAGDCLEVHGTISNEANRNLAMKLARETSHMTVVDHMTMATVPAQPAPSRPSNMVYRDAVQTLYHDCPQLSRALTVSTQDQGDVLVRGEVPTLEDKLAVSRALKAVAGCNCVRNQIRAKSGTSISLHAPGSKQPLQDNSLLARLGLVQPRTEIIASSTPIRHQTVRERPTELATNSTATAPKSSVRESAPQTPRTDMASAATVAPTSTLSPFHAVTAAKPAPSHSEAKSMGTVAVSPQPVEGSILLTSTPSPSESDHLRKSIALTCGIQEKAVLVVAMEAKALTITMTLPDVETGKSMAAKVLAMPELVPYGVSLDVRIANDHSPVDSPGWMCEFPVPFLEARGSRSMDGRQAAEWNLSLVIPAFNEVDGIACAVAEAVAALAQFAHNYEVLVVDDGSSDGTAAVVEELARQNRHVRLLKHPQNQGYGTALRTGFEAARYEFIAFTDADCQFDLADLEPLLALAADRGIAVGRREKRKDSARRRFFSWGYNVLVRALLGTGVRDCDCALKVFRRDILEKILPTTPGYFVNTEMLTRARQLNIRPAERPVLHRPRLHGVSKVALSEIPRTLATLLPFWWSSVLFPASSTEQEPQKRARPAWEFWIVLVAACLVFFSRSHLPLQEPEESRYAEIPRQMLEAGSLTVPVLHGQPYYDKPPLLYWLVMASYQTFGVHDWAARLVMSLAGLVTVLAIYCWGARAFNRRTGLAAALVLCLGARFVYLERLVTMNGLLALWTTLSLAAAYFAVASGRMQRRWWFLAAVACGLGLLTKGPVTLVLVAVPVALWPLLDPRAARPRIVDWALFAGMSILVAGPWFVAASLKDPEFVTYFFWKHHVVRYVTPFDHAKPPWYYASDLLLGLFPGSILLVPLCWLLFDRSSPDAARRTKGLGFVLLAAVWCFAFFSLAGSKRAGYILPLLPLLALSCGIALDLLLGSVRPAVVRRFGALGAQATQAIWVGTGVCGVVAVNLDLLALVPGVLLILVCLLVLACGMGLVRRLTPTSSWAAGAASALAILLAGTQLILPSYAKRFAMRNQVRGQMQAGSDPTVPVICYPRCWDSVTFYLGRTDVRVYTRDQRGRLIAALESEPRTLAFVKAGVSLTEFLRALPRELEFVEQGRRGEVAVGWVRPKLSLPESLVAGEP